MTRVVRAPSLRHPFHRSLATGEVEPTSGHLEISLRIDSVELEGALRTRFGLPINLDDLESSEAFLATYTKECCLARSRDQATGRTVEWAEFLWVGYELEGLDAWLYFEFVLPKSGDLFDLCLALLHARNPFQENLAILQDRDGRRCSLRSTPEAPWAHAAPFLWRAGQRLPPPASGWILIHPAVPNTLAWWRQQGLDWRR
jgi:hypothetical protein